MAELQALTSSEPEPLNGTTATATNFRVRSSADTKELSRQLAYWESIGTTSLEPTAQVRGEAAALIARNGVALDDLPKSVPELVDTKLPNKRCLRYATHGLHEYRGKFFPQLVRAFINMAQIPADGLILDPMCGSGTTLVETIIAGRHAHGVDLNPLSVFVSRVKCEALRLDSKRLIAAFHTLENCLKNRPPKLGQSSYYSSFSDSDREYLQKWFAASVLEELDHIAKSIQALAPENIQDFFRLCLSNILRGVSWQKEDDLRVRREKITPDSGEVITRFLEEARRSTKAVVAFVTQRGRKGLGSLAIHEGDARAGLKSQRGSFHAVITSPPYATALPYLDTDRLSLIYLGLLPRKKHRHWDTLMIGNRELTDGMRRSYWAAYELNAHLLPNETQALIERIERLNCNSTVGFRRRNLAALLAKYFFDMRSAIEQQSALLRAGGVIFMVVGSNRTTAGGEQVDIQTPLHLCQIAKSVGLRIAGNLSMEMLSSRDIFRKNAMVSEQILTFQKGQ
jgi:site-specific DNA-methyltransferase (cytosine-N4-specific)